MLELNLNQEEAEVLEGTLRDRVSELHSEIRYTDSHDFKEMLKHRRDILVRILDSIQQSESAKPES